MRVQRCATVTALRRHQAENVDDALVARRSRQVAGNDFKLGGVIAFAILSLIAQWMWWTQLAAIVPSNLQIALLVVSLTGLVLALFAACATVD